MGVIINVPPQLQDLNQKGLLERAFHDPLYVQLQFRAEALWEEWTEQTGQEFYMTRRGLLKPATTPIQPGQDPPVQQAPYEQWVTRLEPYGTSSNTHMPTSTTANASLLLSDIAGLGLQAGQTMNRVCRNKLFRAYLSGMTVSLTTISTSDTSLRVASLNGFTDLLLTATNAKPQPVSVTAPLPITIGTGGSQVAASVIGFIQDNPNDPLGSGTLLLSAAVGVTFGTSRQAVVSAYAPRVIRATPGLSVDSIGPSDGMVLQMAINAVAFLRQAGVAPHEDGYYHGHVSPLANAQFFSDAVFQRLNQSLPEHAIYKEGFIGTISGIMFFMNNEAPDPTTVEATLTPTASGGFYSSDIGAEVINGAGTAIGRIIITGRGSLYERSLDASKFVTEAGITGKTGEFDVINNNIKILTERIQLILRAPIDALQQVVTSSWYISTDFPVPSDQLATSGKQRYKRAIVLEFAT